MRLTVGSSSIGGAARGHNQDRVLAQPLTAGGLLVVIADGLGGYAASEEASALASRWVAARLEEAGRQGTLTRHIMVDAVQGANLALWQLGCERSSALKTTLSALLCTPTEAYLAHVGDCRVYHVRQAHVRQLTRDHSWSRELGVLSLLWRFGRGGTPSRQILSRALGDQPIVRIDAAQLIAHPGDRFVLCSDGVWGSISPSDFTALATLDIDDHALAENLTAAALARGGTDDATAAVVSVQRVTEQLESCLVAQPLATP
jgi:serine/threonine protein phosphatase PrpC